LACLWLASKAEETPKKSKEILCAARNLSLPFEDHLTPDDEMFEHQSKIMITLERYLLEIVAFDFRARNSAEVLGGLCHAVGADRATGTAALAICLDVYRTLAVLKQTRQTLACACLELAARFLEKGLDTITDEEMYAELGTSRAEVIGKFSFHLRSYTSSHMN
jgi:CTD kinase subunit beta